MYDFMVKSDFVDEVFTDPWVTFMRKKEKHKIMVAPMDEYIVTYIDMTIFALSNGGARQILLGHVSYL